MKPIKFEVKETDEKLMSQAGLALVGQLVATTDLRKRLNSLRLPGHPSPDIQHGDIIVNAIGLVSMGKTDFDDIEEFREDPFFSMSLGIKDVASAPSFRQRFNELAKDPRVSKIIREENVKLVKKNAPEISPAFKDSVALDIDVSPFDNSGTKKEGVSFTYKKVDGYAPNFAYVGEEGYMIDCELREGKQHSQDGTPEFLRGAIRKAWQATDRRPLVRMDAGFDDKENIEICRKERADFIIKRNIRQESKDEWLTDAYVLGELTQPREGKDVYIGKTWRQRENMRCRVVFEVTQRTMTPQGQKMLVPDVEAETFWTNLRTKPQNVLDLYDRHGTSEQFHSEVKTDLDLERLPSGKFDTNALMLLVGMMAYNVLRVIGQSGLKKNEKLPDDQRAPFKKKIKRRRLRSVMQDLIYLACRLKRHSRRWGILIWKKNPWRVLWEQLYAEFSYG